MRELLGTVHLWGRMPVSGCRGQWRPSSSLFTISQIYYFQREWAAALDFANLAVEKAQQEEKKKARGQEPDWDDVINTDFLRRAKALSYATNKPLWNDEARKIVLRK